MIVKFLETLHLLFQENLHDENDRFSETHDYSDN